MLVLLCSVATQFFGPDPPPGTNCTDKAGNTVQCTADCEVRAQGVHWPLATTTSTATFRRHRHHHHRACRRCCLQVLGIGVPTFTVRDPAAPFMGINVTHFSVASLPTDTFQCPYDPTVSHHHHHKQQQQQHCHCHHGGGGGGIGRRSRRVW